MGYTYTPRPHWTEKLDRLPSPRKFTGILFECANTCNFSGWSNGIYAGEDLWRMALIGLPVTESFLACVWLSRESHRRQATSAVYPAFHAKCPHPMIIHAKAKQNWERNTKMRKTNSSLCPRRTIWACAQIVQLSKERLIVEPNERRPWTIPGRFEVMRVTCKFHHEIWISKRTYFAHLYGVISSFDILKLEILSIGKVRTYKKAVMMIKRYCSLFILIKTQAVCQGLTGSESRRQNALNSRMLT